MELEITDIRESNMYGVKAMLSIKFEDKLIIRGFSLRDTKTGPKLEGPKRLLKDGRWTDIVVLDDFLKQRALDKALEAYKTV